MKGKTLQFLFVCLVLGIGQITGSYAAEVVVQLEINAEVLSWGHSVDISEDTFIASNPGYTGNGGGAHIYVLNKKNEWEVQAKFDSEAGFRTWFGWDVSLEEDTAVIGAKEDGGRIKAGEREGVGHGPGFVYVYVRNEEGEWSEQALFTSSDKENDDSFGTAVSLSGDTVAVGSPLDDDAGSSSGSVYIFVRNGDKWTEQTKITAADAAEGDRFGFDVSLDGNTLIVGAPLDDDAGSKSGAAYVFVRSGEAWTQQAKLLAADLDKGDNMGVSVSLSKSAAIVGSYWDDDAGSKSGSAYIFARSGDTWTQQAKLTASDARAGDNFGFSVAINANRALVGAPLKAGKDQAAGTVYAFLRIGSEWKEQKTSVPKDVEKGEDHGPTSGDNFGNAVALADRADFAIVGARFDTHEKGAAQGSVYIYDTKADLNIAYPVDPSSSLVTTTLGQIKRSALLQNFPNPFNPETWMPYVLATESPVTIGIYNVQGQLVRQLDFGVQESGGYVSRESAGYWDGKDQAGEAVSSGIYFYQLKAGTFEATRRMVILK
jgi:hypothetical protein